MDIISEVTRLEGEALSRINWAEPYRVHEGMNTRIANQDVCVRFEVKSLGSDHLRAQYWVGANYYLNTKPLKKSQLLASLQSNAAAREEPGTAVARARRNFGEVPGAKQ